MSLSEHIRGGLIVSCHIDETMGIDDRVYLEGLVRAVESGGAKALRIEGAEHIRGIRKLTSLPIIGFEMGRYDDGAEMITPSLDDIRRLTDAGADIIAIDGTNRKRRNGKDGFLFLEEARHAFDVPLWSDISSFAEGVRSAEIGFDFIATTLSGFTPATAEQAGEHADFELIDELAASLMIPVIAEGRLLTPEDAVAAFEAGAWAVVAGSAITRPSLITKMFVNGINRHFWGNL